ncbi:MAG: VOC family protein [Bacteroidetes bacterium]|nr:VOC family protein [Bacteroidota bacterium]
MPTPVYPCLWFDGKAHEAADFYCSVFPNSRLLSRNDFIAVYEINGSRMMNMNGGPEFTFNEAMSLVISCDTQEEIDYYWEKLTAGGQENKCGWLKDRYGVSWQVIPSILGPLMNNPATAPKVLYAFMQMKKFIIADLEKAANS